MPCLSITAASAKYLTIDNLYMDSRQQKLHALEISGIELFK